VAAEASFGPLSLAREFASQLRERSCEIEEHRALPNDLAKELAAAGLYRLWVPEVYGGFETPPQTAMEMLEILAQGDVSTAWCVFVGLTSSLLMASLPEEAAREIFARPDTVMAGVFAPSGKAIAVPGGVRVSGHWTFGSGTRNADWITCGCEPAEPGTRRPYHVGVPGSALEFADTWHVAGLCGTGSGDYKPEDVFVPSSHVVDFGAGLVVDTPLYRFPAFTLLGMCIGAIALGLARAALSDFAELAREKVPSGGRRPLRERREVHAVVGRAEARTQAARAFFFDSLQRAWDSACGSGVTLEQRREIRLATCNAVDAAVEVAETVYRQAGAAAPYKSSPLQRHLRDAHVITQHMMVRPLFYEIGGANALGVDHKDAVFL